jgi:hypothetical protein
MNKELLKQELEKFSKKMIDLIENDGVVCPRCGEKIYELLPSGVCFDCKKMIDEQNRIEKIKIDNVDTAKVEKEKQRVDIFG